MRCLILAAVLAASAPALTAADPQTADQKLDAIMGLLQAQGGRFASIEARLDALEGKAPATRGLTPPAPPPVLPAPPRSPEWQDLFAHLTTGHGYHPSYLQSMSVGQLQTLHNAAHGGVQTGVVRGYAAPVAAPVTYRVAASYNFESGGCANGNCAAPSFGRPLLFPRLRGW